MDKLFETLTELKESEEFDEIPLHLRTPITEAGEVVSSLAELWNKEWLFEEKMEFFENIFKDAWNDENNSGDETFKQVKKVYEMTDWEGEPLVAGFKEACVSIAILLSACAYAVQAIKASKGSNEAWVYAVEANKCLGLLQGLLCGRFMEADVRKKKMIDGRHAENRSMFNEAMKWFDKNASNFRSLDGAAEEASKNAFPVTFRTARK